MKSIIRFLDTPKIVTVETPIEVQTGWGDRVSRTQNGPAIWRRNGEEYSGCSYEGRWWETSLVVATSGGREWRPWEENQILETWHLVSEAWQAAIESDPDIADAVERYRLTLDNILEENRRHDLQWKQDALSIAQAFRRKRVHIGEQTVPGKVTVRSTRGTLLGYANVWNGRWEGTVDRF